MTRNDLKNIYETISSVKKLDPNTYMLDYKYDYDIDDLIAAGGAKSTGDLLKYAAKHFFGGLVKFDPRDLNGACSSFNTFNADGDHLLARNFDYKDGPCFVVWTHATETAYATVSMVDANLMLFTDKLLKPRGVFNQWQTVLAPYMCVDGMNEKGLAICVLQIHGTPTNQDRGKIDLPTTAAIRVILDKAANVEEALEIFDQFDLHDPMGVCYHYHLTDASGASALVEFINNEMRVIYPGDEEYARWMSTCECKEKEQFVVNFFLTEEADHSGDDGYNDADPCGDRASRLAEGLKASGGIMSELQAMDLLSKVMAYYCHEKYPWFISTLWSNVYNCNKRTMTLCARMNYYRAFELSVTEPMKWKRVR